MCFNVTTSPSLDRVKQQIRDATPWGKTPRFLVHDNDGIFGQFGQKVTVENEEGKKKSYRCHLDRWLDEMMGIEGLPIPYGAPNASPPRLRRLRLGGSVCPAPVANPRRALRLRL